MTRLTRSEQARINGAKSRGPKTVEGKRRSSMNALKPGKYGKNVAVLSTEDRDAFNQQLALYIRRMQPECPIEMKLVHEIASIDWRLARILAMDTRVVENEMGVHAPALELAGTRFPELTRTTVATSNVVDRSRFPDYLARRESQLVRARESTIRTFYQLRKRFRVNHPSAEILLPEPVDPERDLQIEPKTNPKRTKVEPISNPVEPATNLTEPEAA